MRRAELGLDQKAASIQMGQKENQCNRWEGGAIPEPPAYRALEDFLGIDQDRLGALVMESRMRKWKATGR